jgi:hypothetical protein
VVVCEISDACTQAPHGTGWRIEGSVGFQILAQLGRGRESRVQAAAMGFGETLAEVAFHGRVNGRSFVMSISKQALRRALIVAVVGLGAGLLVFAGIATFPAEHAEAAAATPPPHGGTEACMRNCDIMNGYDACISACRVKLEHCTHCCLLQSPSASAAHCRAVCSDNDDTFECPNP